MLNSAENVFDLSRPDVRVKETNRRFAVQRTVRSLEPRRSFFFGSEHRDRLAGDARDTIQAIGLVGVEPAGLAATRQRSGRHVEHCGGFERRQSKPFAQRLQRSVRESFFDALPQLG